MTRVSWRGELARPPGRARRVLVGFVVAWHAACFPFTTMGCFSFILPSPIVEENEPPEFFNTLAEGSLIQVIDDSSSFLAIVEDPDGEPDGVVSFVWTAQGPSGAVFVPSVPQSLTADTGDSAPRLFGSVITLPYDDTLTELNCAAFDPQGADAQRTWLLEVL